MKAIYIYNPNSAPEISLIERAKEEMTTYINVVPINEIPNVLKQYISATPALIVITDDLQGGGLMATGTDGKLLSTAMLYKRLDEEEIVIHNQNNERLDSMINAEKTKAIDDYTLTLIEGGII